MKHLHKSFGSSQPRFRQSKPNVSMTEVTNLITIGKEPDPNEKAQVKKKVNRSRPRMELACTRVIAKTENEDERPLCYGEEAHTIASKAGHKTQLNAPFMSQCTRFGDNENIISLLEDVIGSESPENGDRK